MYFVHLCLSFFVSDHRVHGYKMAKISTIREYFKLTIKYLLKVKGKHVDIIYLEIIFKHKFEFSLFTT